MLTARGKIRSRNLAACVKKNSADGQQRVPASALNSRTLLVQMLLVARAQYWTSESHASEGMTRISPAAYQHESQLQASCRQTVADLGVRYATAGVCGWWSTWLHEMLDTHFTQQSHGRFSRAVEMGHSQVPLGLFVTTVSSVLSCISKVRLRHFTVELKEKRSCADAPSVPCMFV